MQTFPDYIRQRLENNGYQCIKQSGNDVFMREQSSLAKPVWICYVDVPLEPEQIRRCFEFPGHVLFVVKESLIPQEIDSRQKTPMWLRVLHGLYMGRVYVWNDRYLFGLHFDYDTGDVSESGIIHPDELLLLETPTWLRGWPGTYRVARFIDKRWWNEPINYRQGRANSTQDEYDARKKYENETGHSWWDQRTDEKQSSSQQSARQAYEDSRDHYWRKQKQREGEQRQREQQQSNGSYPPFEPFPPPPNKSSGQRDFMREFAQAGSPSAIKALFRKLAREFHPDLNPGVDTTEIMQQVNAAYERFK